MKRHIKDGDRVRLLDGSNLADFCGGWNRENEEWCGKICIVNDVTGNQVLVTDTERPVSTVWDVRRIQRVGGERDTDYFDLILAEELTQHLSYLLRAPEGSTVKVGDLIVVDPETRMPFAYRVRNVMTVHEEDPYLPFILSMANAKLPLVPILGTITIDFIEYPRDPRNVREPLHEDLGERDKREGDEIPAAPDAGEGDDHEV